MIANKSIARERVYVRTRDGMRVSAQFVSGDYTHVVVIDLRTGRGVVFRLEDFFRDFEEETPPRVRHRFDASAEISLVPLEQRDIEIGGELWGHALTTHAGGWLIHRVNWDTGDLEWITSVDREDEIHGAVLEWLHENPEDDE